MRHTRQFGLVDRWLAVTALVGVVGCTQAATTGGDRAATPGRGTADAVAESDDASVENTAADEVAHDGADDGEVAVVAVDEEVAAESSGPAVETAAVAADPQGREAAKPIVEEYAANVPRVMLSGAHAKLCKVRVGDVLPTIELPSLAGAAANLEALAGSQATVVLFWMPDRWMAKSALRDLMRDAAARFAADKVSVVGIVVNTPAAEAEQAAADAGAKFPQLVDADGAAFAQVGEQLLPRIYVLDAQRRVAWFDVEYSESTRRELQQTLAALTGAEQ